MGLHIVMRLSGRTNKVIATAATGGRTDPRGGQPEDRRGLRDQLRGANVWVTSG
jgi:hypothetical protein